MGYANTSVTKEEGEDDDWGGEAKKKRRKKKEASIGKKSKKKSHINLDMYQNSASSNNSTPRESPVMEVLNSDVRMRSSSSQPPPNHPPILTNKLIFNLSHLQSKSDDSSKLDKQLQKDKNRKSTKKKR